MIALAVTLVCLPVLVLDVLSGPTRSGATEVPTSSDSSLVSSQSELPEDAIAIVDPSEVEMDSPATVPTTTPPTTAARAPQATTTVPRPTTTVRARSSDAEFLKCVRWRESRDDYTASDPSGTFLGAYQIYQGGWDAVAAGMGRHDLVGVPPNRANPADQDAVAIAMLARYGRSTWSTASGCN